MCCQFIAISYIAISSLCSSKLVSYSMVTLSEEWYYPLLKEGCGPSVGNTIGGVVLFTGEGCGARQGNRGVVRKPSLLFFVAGSTSRIVSSTEGCTHGGRGERDPGEQEEAAPMPIQGVLE